MRRLTAFLLAGAVWFALPAEVRADGFLAPYIGVNFSGDTTKETVVYGGALGFLGSKAGFEVDFGYTPDFLGDETPGVDSTLSTMMANVLLGGRRGGFSPYFAIGAGVIRTNFTVTGDVLEAEASKNNWGGNIGGGFFAGGRSVTVRGDIRYYRAFDFSNGFEDLGLDLDILDDTLGFWRATVGVGLMW